MTVKPGEASLERIKFALNYFDIEMIISTGGFIVTSLFIFLLISIRV